MSKNKKPKGFTLRFNPNEVKVRDMRAINLTGCGFHSDKKKESRKKSCRRYRWTGGDD